MTFRATWTLYLLGETRNYCKCRPTFKLLDHLNLSKKGVEKNLFDKFSFLKSFVHCNYSFRYLEHHVGVIATIEDGTEDFTACWQHQFVCRHLLVIIADQGYIIQPGLLSQLGERVWYIPCKIIPLETELLRHRDFW